MLVIKGGTLVTPEGQYAADIFCEDGRIAEIAIPGARGAGEADETIDARGLLVYPGFIDPHVHSRDPGLTHKEDFSHSTRAAAAGGVTTVLEMPNAVPPVADVATFEQRARDHEANAQVDFGLWGLSLGSENMGELPALVEAGVVGVKLFWGYALHKETRQLVYNISDEPPENLLMPPDDGEVYELFRTMAGCGGLLAAHCENRTLIEASERALGHPPADYREFLAARSEAAEPAAIALGAEFSRSTGCQFHVVHVSTARGADLVRDAHREGTRITAETCPHYLTLTEDSFRDLGPAMKIYPPIRSMDDQRALWSALTDGTIASLGSDHAPHTKEEKDRDLAAAPAGAVGVETIAPLMLDAVARGQLSPERLCWLLSESTARLYGIYPQKGSLLPGTDADFTLVDPGSERDVLNENLHSKHPVSPWHGWTLRGGPCYSVLRGKVVMQDSEPIGEATGRLVKPLLASQEAGTAASVVHDDHRDDRS